MTKYILLFILFAFTACGKVDRVEKRNENGIVVERYNRSRVDSLMEGTYEAFDDDGVILERAIYSKGKLNGARLLYHPNGKVQYEETHVNGEFQGPYRAYYPSGSLQVEGQFVDNVAEGIWTGYYEDGTVKETVTYANNLENGPFKEWYSNGAIKAEGNYANGDKEQGELILYDLQGEIQKRMHCEAGICRTIWTAETKKANEE